MSEPTIQCLLCPTTTMSTVRRHGVVVDHCPSCGGHWFDRGELSSWVRESGGDPERTVEDATMELAQNCRHCGHDNGRVTECEGCGGHLALRCPRDGSDLYVVDELGVQIDVCGDCYGIWFDANELTRVAETWDEEVVRQAEQIRQPCHMCGTIDPRGRADNRGIFRCRDCQSDHHDGNESGIRARRHYNDHWQRRREPAAHAPPAPTPGGAGEPALARTLARLFF